MSGGEYSRPKLDLGIDQVKDLIEGCIQRYINKSECMHALELQNQIDPNLTEIIWNEIEKQNEEFFRAYYVRLILIEQIRKFNELLERQMGWMTSSGVVPAQMHKHIDPSLDLNIGQQASKIAEEMQKLDGYGFIDAPAFCDRPPKNIEPYRTVNLQQFGSSRFQGSFAPQNIQLYDTGHLQENVSMSRYDPKFGNRDGTMTRNEMWVISGDEAGNLGLNPGPYGCFVELAALMGDASIGCHQSNKSN